MKHLRKIMALALAAFMALAIALPAFADPDYSITINNAKAGETYTAYKMFDLSVDNPENPTAFRYTVNAAWSDFAKTAEFTKIFTVDNQGYVTTTQTDQPDWSGTSDFSKLADSAAQYAKTNNIASAGSVTIGEGETSGKIELSGAGYYVISSTLGSRAMIESTPSNAAVTINEKNEADTIDKTVKEDSTDTYGDSNDVQVGDTVEFKTVVTVVPRSTNVKVHDAMDSGLTLNADSITVYSTYDADNPADNVEYTSATVRAGTGDFAPDNGDTFTIDIPDAFAAEATASQTLTVIYTAEVNSGAVVKDENGVAIVGQNNKTTVSFGNGTSSTEDSTSTTTHKFNVFKHAGDSADNLADAIFQLEKNGVVVNLVKLDDNNYRVVDDTETGEAATHVAENNEVATVAANSIVKDFVTVANGDIVIWGVDSDSDYTITELQAPKGYNLLADPVAITVSADNSYQAEVKNLTGTELPSTGGIGTTILYIIGGALLVGGAIVLISRRRVADMEK